MTTRRPGRDRALLILLYGAMPVASLLFLLNAINDPDFFWHLKTGEWIWQHRGLPVSDPFNFLNPADLVEKQRFTLVAYWLTQVGYHLVHGLFGMPGIAALKYLVFCAIVAAMVRLRRGDPVIHAALVLSAIPMLGVVYTYDRPQAFSFLFFPLLLLILERERASPPGSSLRRSLPALVLLMLLWGNMHGGHVLGQVTILLFLTCEGLKFVHPRLRPAGWSRYRALLILGGAGLAASLINPGAWHALQAAFTPVPGWMQNEEYKSTLVFFRSQPLVASFWGALVLAALAALFTMARPDITGLALLAGLGYQGFIHVRYAPYFIIAAPPLVGFWLSSDRLRRWARPLLIACAAILLAFAMKNNFPTRQRATAAMRVNEKIYPVRAADFVLANRPGGNLYNTYFWGGYLIWRLGTERKVFVDGRGLTRLPIFQSFSISIAYSNPSDPPPLWKRLLRQYDIGYLIIPSVDRSGGIKLDDVSRLRQALLQAPEWVPVFSDPVSLVFVRNAPEHREIIRRHQIPRQRLIAAKPSG